MALGEDKAAMWSVDIIAGTGPFRSQEIYSEYVGDLLQEIMKITKTILS